MKKLRPILTLLLAIALFMASWMIVVRKRQQSDLALSETSAPAKSAAATSRPTSRMSVSISRRPFAQLETERRAQDQFLEALLSDPNRTQWTLLPNWVREAWFDRQGHAVFGASYLDRAIEQQQLSIEELFAGKTRVARVPGIVLFDSKGRIWRDRDDDLECYDGKKWTTYTFDLRPSTMPAPATRRSEQGPILRRSYISFSDTSFEDSAGNCWFVGSQSDVPGLLVVRMAPDGTKVEFPIVDDGKRADSTVKYAQTAIFEQAGGKLTLVTPMYPHVDESADFELRIFRFDGVEWKRINPQFCDHKFSFVIPQKNGSLKLICNAGRIWSYWPPDTMEQIQKQVMAWLGLLDDPDPVRREEASRGMLSVGPQFESLLPAALNEDLSPSSRAYMQSIRENNARMALVDENGLHSELAAYTTETKIGAAMPIARTRDGGAMLAARPIKQLGLDNPIPQGFVSIGRDGQYSIRSVPAAQFISPYPGGGSPGDGWADTTGGIWRTDLEELDNGKLYQVSTRRSASGEYEHAVPPGAVIDELLGEDSDGRVYVKIDARIAIYDPARPTGRAWRMLKVAGDSLTPSADGRVGVGMAHSVNAPTRLIIVSATGTKSVTPPMPVAEYRIIALRGSAFILEVRDPRESKPALFYDGVSQWYSAADLSTLVKEHADAVMAVAPSTLEKDREHSRVVADMRDDGIPRGLWLAGWQTQLRYHSLSTTSPNQRGPARLLLEYFDGKVWHDTAADLAGLDPTAYRGLATSTDRGHTMVLDQDTKRSNIFLSYSFEHQFNWQQIANAGLAFRLTFLEESDGLWAGSNELIDTLKLVHGDQVESYSDKHLMPLLKDGGGRVWFSDQTNKMLIVKDGKRWIETKLPAMERDSRMLESADGRLWLLQPDAIWLTELTDDGSEKKSIHLERFEWDGPKMTLQSAFIDSQNGLWIDGKSQRLVRYVLPVATARSAAATQSAQ